MLKTRANQIALGKALGESHIVGDLNDLPSQVVKSAGRVLQVLELFDVLRREVAVSEVCELLSLPQSSTSVLLRSMANLGYLTHDRKTRTYYPTSKVAFLGSWITAPMVSDCLLLQLTKRLSERTGEAVVLAIRDQTASQYVHVVQAVSAARLYIINGSRRSLIASSTGYCLLSDLSDDEIRRIAHLIRFQSKPADKLPSIYSLMEIIAGVRRDGYAMTLNLVTPGGGMIAMPLPKAPGFARYAVGIGGVSELIAEKKVQIVAALKEELTAYAALIGATNSPEACAPKLADERVPVV